MSDQVGDNGRCLIFGCEDNHKFGVEPDIFLSYFLFTVKSSDSSSVRYIFAVLRVLVVKCFVELVIGCEDVLDATTGFCFALGSRVYEDRQGWFLS